MAFQSFDGALNVDPSSSIALVNRASIYKKTGKSRKALADLTKAIKLDPGSSFAYAERGDIYFNTGKILAARKDTAMALKIDPNNVLALKIKARLEFLTAVAIAVGLALGAFVIRGTVKTKNLNYPRRRRIEL